MLQYKHLFLFQHFLLIPTLLLHCLSKCELCDCSIMVTAVLGELMIGICTAVHDCMPHDYNLIKNSCNRCSRSFIHPWNWGWKLKDKKATLGQESFLNITWSINFHLSSFLLIVLLESSYSSFQLDIWFYSPPRWVTWYRGAVETTFSYPER